MFSRDQRERVGGPAHATGHVALGGNVGDVSATFREALHRLESPELRVVAVSRLFETPPMGVAAGGTFLNAAATIETTLEPLAVLDRLLEVENALGRVRTMHWGPRVIDLDLVLSDHGVIETERLHVPHPGLWYRRFVLDPLADIAAGALHPVTGETVAMLRDRLIERPFTVSITGDEQRASRLRETLSRDFATIELVEPQERPTLRFDVGKMGMSATKRLVGVFADDRGIETARAILTAALGVPEPVGMLSPAHLGGGQP